MERIFGENVNQRQRGTYIRVHHGGIGPDPKEFFAQ
jgi:hypothetical protein